MARQLASESPCRPSIVGHHRLLVRCRDRRFRKRANAACCKFGARRMRKRIGKLQHQCRRAFWAANVSELPTSAPGAMSAHPVRSRRGSARQSAELCGAGLIESVETIGSGCGGSNPPDSGGVVRFLDSL